MKFSRVPKIVENEGEHGFQPEVAMTLRTIRLKMRGFVLGILCLAKLPNSGTNLIYIDWPQRYISATRRDRI